MAPSRIAPQNPEERLIWWALVGGWGFYAAGALYLVGPALAIALMAILAWRAFAAPWRPERERPRPVPPGVIVWLLGMGLMLVALLAAHVGNELGLGQTVKSAIGWLKGWALMALFPLAGACLAIRPRLVIRAFMVFALHTLILIPFLVAAGLLHLPGRLFVSPLQMVGGPGPEFFAVYLYIVDPADHALRWQFITPWAPAAGMLGNLLFILAGFERDRRWRWIGWIAAVLICVMTRSRMAQLFLVLYPPLIWVLARLSRTWLLASAAALAGLGGVVAGPAITAIGDAVQMFRKARADSTRVREALGRIALERWWEDAPIWGHGIVARGRHFVEFMPIGSHHTWYGLLYVKGIVGLAALLLPLVWTFMELLAAAQVTRLGRLGLGVTLLLVYYTFGENLEILAYLIWPGLVVLGRSLGSGAFGTRSLSG